MISDLLIITESKKGFMAARDTNTFAWRLRTERDQLGITQFEMCDRIKAIVQRNDPTFDLSYPGYNKYETGNVANPRLDVVAAISEILGRSLDYLVKGQEPEGEAGFNTEEAEQVASIVDTLPVDLRLAMLEGARMLQRLDREIVQIQIEEALFLDKIKRLLPEQERIQAESILDKINRSRIR